MAIYNSASSLTLTNITLIYYIGYILTHSAIKTKKKTRKVLFVLIFFAEIACRQLQ